MTTPDRRQPIFSMGLMLILCTALLPIPGRAACATAVYFVTPSGTGSGTQADPTNLSAALATAGDGATIYAAAGTYTNLAAAVAVITQDITLLGGWDGTTTMPLVRDPAVYVSILDGDTDRPGIRIDGTPSKVLNVTVDGFTIINGRERDGAGIRIEHASATISNNIIMNNQTLDGGAYTDGRGGGIFIDGTSAVRILNNQIEANQAGYGGGVYTVGWLNLETTGNIFKDNTATYRGGAILLEGGDAEVQGNTFEGNTAAEDGGAILVWSVRAVINANTFTLNEAFLGSAISVGNNGTPQITNNMFYNNLTYTIATGSSSSAIINNTIVGSSLSGAGAGIFINSPPSCSPPYCAGDEIINNIITGHEDGIQLNDSAVTFDVTIDHNDFWDNSNSDIDPDLSPGPDNRFEDPAFVNAAGNDYHLVTASPCVDTGEGIPTAPDDDFDGDSRPQGGGVDIGADELIFSQRFLPLVLK